MALVVTNIRHPKYDDQLLLWTKWRRTYEGGDIFKDAYLKQFSTREIDDEFELRKEVSPIPRFAGAAIDEIKNSIFQRMSDIGREGGGKTYNDAIKGLNGGVDNSGCNMNMFMGQHVLPELLILAKVGVYVDMPVISGDTLASAQGKKPYVYLYTAEEILSWSTYCVGSETYYRTLFLKETKLVYDDDTGLTVGYEEQYRRLWLNKSGYVCVQIYTKAPVETGSGAVGPNVKPKYEAGPVQVLKLTKIPFVCFEINKSLIADIADYQIALLNMESCDISYSLNSNFPFYTEEYDVRENAPHLKQDGAKTDGNTVPDNSTKEIKVGTTHGRRRPRGLAEPAFIHPSSEPLISSMTKQTQIKADIRTLLGLSLSTVQPIHASAASKEQDKGGLESGLSCIGLELENGERRLAEIWSQYVNEKAATVNYPRKYALKTEAERREEAKQQKELQGAAPSRTYQKEVGKQIAETMLGGKISHEKLTLIKSEIDDATYITSDPDAIATDIQNGLVSGITASNARGYDGVAEYPKAQEEHAKKLEAIASSQAKGLGTARGGDPTNANPNASKQEKKGKPQRGGGK